ncbi:hypothetical protein HY032_02595, partial [Candidatus Gottesmanbacteria bacterium]|nr:hypothetical protein [Candidatus Gottesmanbacteria bacterium]
MKNKNVIVVVLLVLLLGGTGFVVYKALAPAPKIAQVREEEAPAEMLEALDPSIVVNATKSRAKDNTVVVSVNGLSGKVRSVAYELTYESQGLVKGVNSGSKPIDVAGKDNFEREVYLGTCSRNVCKP